MSAVSGGVYQALGGGPRPAVPSGAGSAPDSTTIAVGAVAGPAINSAAAGVIIREYPDCCYNPRCHAVGFCLLGVLLLWGVGNVVAFFVYAGTHEND